MATRALPDLIARLQLDLPTSQVAAAKARAAELGAAFQGSTAGINAAEKSAANLHSRLATLNGALLDVAKLAAGGLVAGVGAAAAGMGEAVGKAGAYQAQLQRLVGTAGESEQNIGMVGSAILAMAGTVGYSAQDLAGAMYTVESAGFHAGSGLSVLQTSAEAAKAENADLAVVADAVTSALNAYGLQGNQATQVTDQMLTAVSLGKTNFQDLAGSMGEVLPTAASAGVGLDQVGAAMATMTAQGTQAQMAATDVGYAIRGLENPSSTAQQTLKDLGVGATTFADELRSKGLFQTLQDLQDAIGNKFPAGSAQYNAALQSILGNVQGLQAVLELGGQHAQTFQSNLEAMGSSGGKTTAVFDDQMKTFNGTMDRFRSGADAAGIAIGTQLLPYVTSAAGWLADHLVPASQALTTTLQQVITAIQGGADPMQVLDTALTDLGVGADNAQIASDDLGTAWNILKGAFDDTKASLGAIVGFVGKLNDLGLLVPILGGLAGAWAVWNAAVLVSNIQLAVNAALAGGPGLAAFAIRVIAATIAMGPLNAVTALWNILLTANPIGLIILGIGLLIAGIILLVTHWSQVTAFIGGTVWPLMQQFGGWISGTFTALWGTLSGAVGAAWQAIWGSVTYWAGVISGAVVGWALGMRDNAQAVFGMFVAEVAGDWSAIAGGVEAAWGYIYGRVTSWAGLIRDTVVNIFNAAVNGIGSAFSWVGTKVHDGLVTARTILGNFVDFLRSIPFLGGILQAAGVPSSADLPTFAKGAYVDKPTVGVFGEAGPEVLIPVGAGAGPGAIDLWKRAGHALGLGGVHEILGSSAPLECLGYLVSLGFTAGAGVPAAIDLAGRASDGEPAGSVGISTIGTFGHAWLNLGGGLVLDSNFVGNDVIAIHDLSDIPDQVGSIPWGAKLGAAVLSSVPGISAALNVTGAIQGVINQALSGYGGWPGTLAKGVMDATIDGIAKRLDDGGPWPSGTLGYNGSGSTEWVQTAEEHARSGDTYNINIPLQSGLDPDTLARKLVWRLGLR